MNSIPTNGDNNGQIHNAVHTFADRETDGTDEDSDQVLPQINSASANVDIEVGDTTHTDTNDVDASVVTLVSTFHDKEDYHTESSACKFHTRGA